METQGIQQEVGGTTEEAHIRECQTEVNAFFWIFVRKYHNQINKFSSCLDRK